MPATTRMVTSSVVRSSGSRVRNRADRAACASCVSRARCRSIAALTASQTATASKMVTASGDQAGQQRGGQARSQPGNRRYRAPKAGAARSRRRERSGRGRCWPAPAGKVRAAPRSRDNAKQLRAVASARDQARRARRSARSAPGRAPRRRCRSSAACADSRAEPLPPRRARAPPAEPAPASARSRASQLRSAASGPLAPSGARKRCRTTRRCCSTMMPRKTWSARTTVFSSASCAVSDSPSSRPTSAIA